MSEHKSSKNKTFPFDILKRLLDTPHLLPHENKEEFIQLFDGLEAYGKPQTARDYLAVHQATVLTWDMGVAQPPAAGIGVPASQN